MEFAPPAMPPGTCFVPYSEDVQPTQSAVHMITILTSNNVTEISARSLPHCLTVFTCAVPIEYTAHAHVYMYTRCTVSHKLFMWMRTMTVCVVECNSLSIPVAIPWQSS